MNTSVELFQAASARLTHVNEEMNRPEEDVMTFSICNQTRTVIMDLFRSWLTSHGKEHASVNDLETLYTMCCDIDDRFRSMDVRGMYCYSGKPEGKDEYCLDMDQVKSCLHLANRLHDEVLARVTK